MSEAGHGGATARLATLVVVLRFPILLAWVVVAVLAALSGPGAGSARGDALGSLVPGDAEAVAVQLRSAQLFDVPVLSNTLVVQHAPEGLSPAAQRRVIERATRIYEREYPDLLSVPFALPVINTFGLFPGSRERSTAAITYFYVEPTVGLLGRDRLARWFSERRFPLEEDGLVGRTGVVPARVEQGRLIEEALPLVELATVLLIALVIGLNFRSVTAPLLVLAAVAIGYVVALALVSSVGGAAGMSVPQEVEPIVLVLMLGLVTDYSIFYLSALRQRLRDGEARRPAALATSRQIGPIILVAGLMVAAGAASLVVAELEFFRIFGPALGLSVLVGLAVSITFVPAALAVFGRVLLWPRGLAPERASAGPDWWRRHIGLVAGSRLVAALVVLVCVALLLAAASGLRHTELRLTPIASLPGDSEPARAAAAAAEGFAPGIVAPTLLLVEQRGLGGRRAELAALQRLLERREGIAGVVGPRNLPEPAPLGVVLARNGAAARYVLVLEDEPLSGDAVRVLEELDDDLPSLLAEAGLAGARGGLGGNTAIAQETIATVVDDLIRIAVAVLLVNLLLLAIFLRSLVAPFFLLAASVLALTAALGLTTYAYRLLGQEHLTYYVPFMAAVLLVSLGSDYNIFLVGRVWQEARDRPLREAIRVTAPRASRAISVAAVALALSFALLALVPLSSFREFALAMTIGVLLDAFLVRSYLVPALLTLVGNASRWPSRARLGARG